MEIIIHEPVSILEYSVTVKDKRYNVYPDIETDGRKYQRA